MLLNLSDSVFGTNAPIVPDDLSIHLLVHFLFDALYIGVISVDHHLEMNVSVSNVTVAVDDQCVFLESFSGKLGDVLEVREVQTEVVFKSLAERHTRNHAFLSQSPNLL